MGKMSMIMKKCVLATIVMTVHLSAGAQTTEFLEFDNVYPKGEIVVKPSDNAKLLRSFSSHRGVILCDVEGTIPDSLFTCMEVAIDVWQNYLYEDDTLKVQLKFADLKNVDVRTSVAYRKHNNVFYPQSLYTKNTKEDRNFEYDAIITINSNVDWNIGVAQIGANAKNLSYACMQSIALTLGFGTSLTTKNYNNINFYAKYPSVFDRLLASSSGIKLSEITNNETSKLKAFACGSYGKVYARTKNETFEMYAPSTFDAHKSLKYLTDEKSLMYHKIPSDTVDLVVDNATVSLLRAIGWTVNQRRTAQIVGEGIDSTGITSAYRQHRFYLKNGLQGISNYKWTYVLPLKDGTYETVKTSTTSDFVVPAISNESKYKHTLEGDIAGKILFEGYQNGNTVEGVYNVTLELKPHILSASVVKIEPCEDDENLYNVWLNVKYEGSHYLYTSIYEEDFGTAYPFYSYVPYNCTIKMPYISLDGYVWIEVRVANDYGKDVKYIDVTEDEYLKSASQKIDFTKIEFSYSTFDEDTWDFQDTKVHLEFDVDDFQEQLLCLAFWEKGDGNAPSFIDFIGQQDDWTYWSRNGNHISVTSSLGWWWSEMYAILLSTGQGRVWSEKLDPLDYIKDRDIAEMLKEHITTANVLSTNLLDMVLQDRKLILKGLPDNSRTCVMSIVDVSSRICMESKTAILDVSSLPHGIYMAVATLSNNKRIVKKIIL